MDTIVVAIYLEDEQQPHVNYQFSSGIPLPNTGETVFLANPAGGETRTTVTERAFSYALTADGATVTSVTLIVRPAH